MQHLGSLPGDEWGFTAILDRDNGGDFSLTTSLVQAKLYGILKEYMPTLLIYLVIKLYM